mmetsp:Transcript_2202/g.5532  ORF Transcript_2202/g.5532 Transcript_2202/m.5532 type:complete len:81 (+) Transcript_2202:110-352(+)
MACEARTLLRLRCCRQEKQCVELRSNTGEPELPRTMPGGSWLLSYTRGPPTQLNRLIGLNGLQGQQAFVNSAQSPQGTMY